MSHTIWSNDALGVHPDVVNETTREEPKRSPIQITTSARPLNIANEAITQLIQWKPANSNLFEVTFSGITGFSVLHCSAISFPGSQLSFTRNRGTKLFMLDEYQFSDEVTITWREDAKHSVRKFHEAWFSQFYDRSTDKYISSTADNPPQNRYRTAVVHIQAFNPGTLATTLRLRLINMLPTKLPELNLDWSSDSLVEYQLSYKITNWVWEWL